MANWSRNMVSSGTDEIKDRQPLRAYTTEGSMQWSESVVRARETALYRSV